MSRTNKIVILIVFILFLLVLALLLSCKNKISNSNEKNISWGNNNLSHEIFIKTGEYDDLFEKGKISPSKYIVYVDIDDKSLRELKHLSKRQWKVLLTSEESDFVANLLLYQLYEEDATSLIDIDRADWVNCCKEGDLDFWL